MPITRESKYFSLKCERQTIKDEGTPYLDLILCYNTADPSRLVLVIRDGSVEKLDLEMMDELKTEEEEAEEAPF